MTFEIALVLIILVASVVMFAAELLRADMVAMVVLATLAVTGLVTPEEAFSGFANPAVVTVVAIFVISEGLFQTGVADFLGVRILKMARSSERRLLTILMITVAVMSAFMNNVGATAVLLPAVLIMARRARLPSSKLLIPLAFASMMGGNLTLIGTPPNILASSSLREHPACATFPTGCQGFGFFDFAPMGILIVLIGTVYMVLIGRHLLPSNETHVNLTANYNLREYLSEVQVLPDSPLVGKTLIESRFGEAYNLTIVGIMRNGQDRLAVRRKDHIRAKDTLLVKGSLDKILDIHKEEGLRIEPNLGHQRDTDFKSTEAKIAEVMLDIGSNLTGRSIKDIRFREKYRLSVLAMRRHSQTLAGSIADEPLHPGDILLVQGRRDQFTLLRNNPDFLLLEPVHLDTRRTDKLVAALAIVGVMLAIVTAGWLHISVAAVIAAVFMIILGIVSIDEAYQAIDWQSVFLIAGMLPLGIAMETTQAAKFLADTITIWMSDYGPIAIIAGIYILTSLLTQTMSNAAATVLLAPIAINIALDLNADPRAFLMTVVVAASTSFLTPIAHQSNILVFGAGGYKFTDFTKVGTLLTILYLILVITVLPYIWPLYP